MTPGPVYPVVRRRVAIGFNAPGRPSKSRGGADTLSGMANARIRWWMGFAILLTIAIAVFSNPEPLAAGTAASIPAMPWWALALVGGAIALAAVVVFRRDGRG